MKLREAVVVMMADEKNTTFVMNDIDAQHLALAKNIVTVQSLLLAQNIDLTKDNNLALAMLVVLHRILMDVARHGEEERFGSDFIDSAILNPPNLPSANNLEY